VEGVYFCTGNVSFRKTAYLEVGGFDHNLAQSEDRDLGIRMVSAGKRIEFCLAAASVHNSPHTSFKTWLQRAFNYGVWDTRISKKYPDYTKASPWLLVASCNRFSKPILLISIVIPNLGSLVRCGMMLVSSMFEKLGLETFALKCYSIIWSTEYLRGVTQEFGHPLEAIRDYKNFAKKVR
jgi:GT2 family glycosyltransferase